MYIRGKFHCTKELFTYLESALRKLSNEILTKVLRLWNNREISLKVVMNLKKTIHYNNKKRHAEKGL